MYSNSRSTTKTSNKKKIVLVVIGAIVLLLLALFVLEATNTTNFFSSNADNTSNSEDEKAFDAPPTEEEKQSGDNVPIKQDSANGNSDKIDNETDNNGDSENSSSKMVSVIISNAGVYDGKVKVSAFTPDAIANGTCTYIFSSGARNVTKTVQARADASSSICLDEPFPTSELSGSSSWSLEVTYQSSSGTYKGSKATTLAL